MDSKRANPIDLIIYGIGSYPRLGVALKFGGFFSRPTPIGGREIHIG